MLMYVGIVTLITLHILSNLLAQKLPPGVSEIALYAELKLWLTLKKPYFCRTWYEISFSQNYYLKTKPVSLQFNDLISVHKALGLFPSIQTQNNLELIQFWGNRLSQSSECLLKMQTVNSSETLLPRSHVILTNTTLCLFITVKTWNKKPTGWFIQEKLNYK